MLSPDLIYFCGQSIPWDPRSKDLGGSEQAVVELSRHWAGMGLRVEVYGSLPEAMVCDGVTYRPLEQAEATLQADVIVLWRLYGLIGFWQAQDRFRCRLLAVDFHDRELFGHEPRLHQSLDRIQALMFKSSFHADYLLGKLPSEQQQPLRQRVKVIPNGIRKQDFSLSDPPPRELHRFCYASCYLRGLVPLIQFFWPSVRQLWPDAELHVYYGMDNVRDAAVRDGINRLLQSEGVHDHGRQPVSVISEEKHRSSFHLYYTNSVIETDCISIKESAVAGCIPIISGVNVFAERSGVVMPGSASSEQEFRQAAQAFVSWAQQITEPELEKIRQSLRKVITHLDWKQTAEAWYTALTLIPPAITWDGVTALYRPSNKRAGIASSSTTNALAGRPCWRLHTIKYINLAQSTDRAVSMRKQLLQTCPEEMIQRFEAIVGKHRIQSEQEKEFFRNSDFLQSPYFLNIAGNCLSHYRAWEEASGQPEHLVTVILQDDAILISNFKQHLEKVIHCMPTDALCVFISDHMYAAHEAFVPVDLEGQDGQSRLVNMKQRINAMIAKHIDTWADHCSLAYVITPEGAKRLIEHTKKYGFTRATDRYMRDVLVSQDRNYCSIRCLATSSSEVFNSDVWMTAG